PITLTQIMWRIGAKCVARALRQWAPEWASESDHGGLPGRSISDVLFQVQASLHRGASTAALMDVAGYFDARKATMLQKVFTHLGAPVQLAPLLESFYSGAYRYFYCFEGSFDPECHVVHSGIAQGCPLSPIAAAALSHCWSEYIKASCRHINVQIFMDDRTLLLEPNNLRCITAELPFCPEAPLGSLTRRAPLPVFTTAPDASVEHPDRAELISFGPVLLPLILEKTLSPQPTVAKKGLALYLGYLGPASVQTDVAAYDSPIKLQCVYWCLQRRGLALDQECSPGFHKPDVKSLKVDSLGSCEAWGGSLKIRKAPSSPQGRGRISVKDAHRKAEGAAAVFILAPTVDVLVTPFETVVIVEAAVQSPDTAHMLMVELSDSSIVYIAPLHRDGNNDHRHFNLLLPASSFANGQVWVEGRGTTPCPEPAVKRLGYLLPVSEGPQLRSHKLHATCDWQGSRLLIVGFCIRDTDSLSDDHRQRLQEAGLRIPPVVSADPEPPANPVRKRSKVAYRPAARPPGDNLEGDTSPASAHPAPASPIQVDDVSLGGQTRWLR
ncbi:unnamed protein product, partial [Symbiodinium sp. KB8]